MVSWSGIGLLALGAAAGGQAAQAQDCRSELLPAIVEVSAGRGMVTPAVLARLRDFGRQDAAPGGEAPFSVSPDGTLAALVLRRGNPALDSYCIGVAVVPLDGSGPARLVDVGGDLILRVSDVRGIPDLPIGNAEPVTPLWSPDGRSLSYLRRDHGLTRVWLASVDGSSARPLSQLEVDARGVRWSHDGRSLLVTIRPGIATGEAAIDAEARQGFLYDDRFWTLSQSRPKPRLPLPLVEQAIRAKDGTPLGAAEQVGRAGAGRPRGALALARSSSGAIAWTESADPRLVLGPVRMKVSVAGGTLACASRFCSDGVRELWWGEGDALYFVQGPSPDNGGLTSLLRWRVKRESEPRLILSTKDALFGCQTARRAIVCARETATQPRHLVSIDPQSGSERLVYNPNPEFALLRKGAVQRLRWRLGPAVGAYGDLVLPPDHRPGLRHPLVVVQYQSRGFLRGGTGDEYPIHALAARGFAVLSVERTRPVGAGVARSNAELVRMGTSGFAERRRVLASVETGVRKAIALGDIDPQRIGITGLSDGAATVQYALVNSGLFRAAAISSCCDEPSSSMFAAGPGYADLLLQAGFPPPGEDGSAFWQHYSLAANAKRIRTPILLQLTDDEFRFALETFGTLKYHRVPVEMYVFPGEYHQKWRPSHRLATYERAIDWFDFWLNGRTQGTRDKEEQFARWRELARIAQKR
jgi:dipeptidyl aminopeptidase/acylaminoacyl peptidase